MAQNKLMIYNTEATSTANDARNVLCTIDGVQKTVQVALTDLSSNSGGVPAYGQIYYNGVTVPDGYEQVTNPDIEAINNNLSGFKFYPTGTGIVGLIADDSAYTDEDGNYVVWGTPTAEQLVEDNPNTYKSVLSEEDTRGKVGADTASPFSNKFDYNNLIPIQGNATTSCTVEIGHTYLCSIAVFDSRNAHDITNDIVGGELLKYYGVVESSKTVNPKTYTTLHLCVIKATSTQISWLNATHDSSGTNSRFGCFQVFDISDFI